MYRIPKRFRQRLLARFDLNNFTGWPTLSHNIPCALCEEFDCKKCPVYHCSDILMPILTYVLGPDEEVWEEHVQIEEFGIDVLSPEGEVVINMVFEWLQNDVLWTEEEEVSTHVSNDIETL